MLQEILDLLGHGEFLPNDELMKILAQFVCPFDREVEDICEDVIFIICGYDKSNINIVSNSTCHEYIDGCHKLIIIMIMY